MLSFCLSTRKKIKLFQRSMNSQKEFDLVRLHQLIFISKGLKVKIAIVLSLVTICLLFERK